jgi:hypothetical protein
MAKRKLFEDILRDPARFYRAPSDVLRDRRFDDGERRDILEAWQDLDGARAGEIGAALSELKMRAELEIKEGVR